MAVSAHEAHNEFFIMTYMIFKTNQDGEQRGTEAVYPPPVGKFALEVRNTVLGGTREPCLLPHQLLALIKAASDPWCARAGLQTVKSRSVAQEQL